MEKVSISTDFIKLQQALKLSGVVGQGSDVKALIKEGVVVVNGEVATERGKKLVEGDIVTLKSMGNFKIVKE